MTAVVGSEVGPTGKAKNCDTWGEYEPPMKSSFANLCNGGTYDEYRWQPCPSRLECRAATQRRSSLQMLGSTRSGFGTTLPTKQETQLPLAPRVIIPGDGHIHLDTPRLAPQSHYRPSPTFLPKEKEPLLIRFVKNAIQGIIHAIFHQGKELAENTDFFPMPPNPPQKPPEE